MLGLGDVYLGAPVAVPIDPRHRLVTTKYNPARTWTPQNAVGIGGVYLCVYGMEGPGGYQLVGRTVPVWRHRPAAPTEQPWLLRHFDRLRFRPVGVDELADLRADIHAGRADLETRPATFSLAEVDRIRAAHTDEIDDDRGAPPRRFRRPSARAGRGGTMSNPERVPRAGAGHCAVLARQAGPRPRPAGVPVGAARGGAGRRRGGRGGAAAGRRCRSR